VEQSNIVATKAGGDSLLLFPLGGVKKQHMNTYMPITLTQQQNSYNNTHIIKI